MKLCFQRSEVFCVPQKVAADINNCNNLPTSKLHFAPAKLHLGQTSLHHRCNFTLPRATSGCLLSLEAITAGATFRITATRIPYVDFAERAVIPCAVILTFRYATTDARVHFLYVFIHHNKKTSLFGSNSMCKVLKDY